MCMFLCVQVCVCVCATHAFCNPFTLQHVYFSKRVLCNTCTLQQVHFTTCATHAIRNMCNLLHVQFATQVNCNMRILQDMQFSTTTICNMCNFQDMQFARHAICSTCNLQCNMHNAMCKNTPISTVEVMRAYLVSRVVPHLRGDRGSVSCHSPSSLEGGCPSSAEVIEDTEDFIQLQGLL